MKEIWRDIEGYKGKYQVSNTGKVKSLERMKWNGKGYQKIPEKILEGVDDGHGYLHVNLCKDGKETSCKVHRLIAQAFLPNPNNLPEVNDKDEDKTNNCVENLEWCSRQYNIDYSLSKAVIGIDKVSGLILEFPSTMEASRQTGIDHRRINDCLKGRQKSAKGFYWFYADSEEVCDEKK